MICPIFCSRCSCSMQYIRVHRNLRKEFSAYRKSVTMSEYIGWRIHCTNGCYGDTDKQIVLVDYNKFLNNIEPIKVV